MKRFVLCLTILTVLLSMTAQARAIPYDLTLLVKTGDTIDGKTIEVLGPVPSLNDNGNVAFFGSFSGGSGIFTQNSLLAATEDTIDGKTIASLARTGFAALNNNGDVAFWGSFIGGAGIFTPNS